VALGIAPFFHFVAVALDMPKSAHTPLGEIPFWLHKETKFFQNMITPLFKFYAFHAFNIKT
jgi:hypothetical protein